MSNDDLSSWLKVVAENKITTKNTWKSTLIEHFRDIKQFKDLQGINFQKASCTLDGCIKVYSTRVDDVSEEALKLLEGFNLEDTNKKKSSKRKGIKTIETNISNINIKNNLTTTFRDSTFLSLDKKAENILLLSTLQISLDGVFRMYKDNEPREIKMCPIKIDGIDLENRQICPTFNKMKELTDLVEVEMEEEHFEPNYNESIGDFDYQEEEPKIAPVFKESAFSYFKGWAGPRHWKIRSKKIDRNSTSKTKEKFLINFSDPIDINLILDKGDTLIDRDTIEKRKEVNNSLPDDFNLEIDDLYSYNILPVKFNSTNEAVYDDLSIINEPNIIVEEPIDEIVADIPIDNKNKEVLLPFRREQKKVDIKKLKSNIITNIKNKKNSKLSDLCKEVPKMYDCKEGSDISIHFCIVSLLHIANERNLELVQRDNDVFIN
ncbi:hypothetical protein P3W45_001569 [Vairimorpha bombi]|jgi:condensin complex subunit 2